MSFSSPAQSRLSGIKTVFRLLLAILTVTLAVLSIYTFRNECAQSPLPPHQKRISACQWEKSFDIDKTNTTFSESRTWGQGQGDPDHSTGRTFADSEEQEIMAVREEVLGYFSSRRSLAKQECIAMFDEDDNDGLEGRFFMKAAPSNRVHWIFFQKKTNNNSHVEVQFCPLFKSGSTSWMAVFTKLSGALTNETAQQLQTGKVTFPTLAKNFRLHISSGIRSPEGYRALRDGKVAFHKYSLVVVRHPFTRILSAYRDKIEQRHGRSFYEPLRNKMLKLSSGKDVTRNAINAIKTTTTNPIDLSRTPTFEEFCYYLLETDPRLMNEHWRPQFLDCSPCHHNFDLILKLEDSEDEHKKVFQLIGYTNASMLQPSYEELDMIWRNWSNQNSKSFNEEFYFSQVPLEMLKRLYTLYKPDFRLFGYSPENYFRMAK